MKPWRVLLPMLALAGCGEGSGARPALAPPAPPIPVPTSVSGSTNRIALSADDKEGKGARALIAQFGSPRIDMREGPARKLQFAGPDCVLDIYLYPPAKGREAVAKHVDTRLRDGRTADMASCVAALRRVP